MKHFNPAIILIMSILLITGPGCAIFNGNHDGNNGTGDEIYTLGDLSKRTFQLFEWTQYFQKPTYDALNNAAFRWLVSGEGEGEVRDRIMDFADEVMWKSEGGGRYAIFVLMTFDLVKSLLSQDEQDRILGTAAYCVKLFHDDYAKDAYKQATAFPCAAYFGYSYKDDFINTGYTPTGLEWGSSHYGPLGQTMYVLGSYFDGKVTDQQAKDFAGYMIGIATIAPATWGREYYNWHRGASLMLTCYLTAMWITPDVGQKQHLKWIIDQKIKDIERRGTPIYIYAPMFILAGWDDIKAHPPITGCHLEDKFDCKIRHKPQECYKRVNFDQAEIQSQLAIMRTGWGEGSTSVVIDLACPNNKGDRNCGGSILSIEFNGIPRVQMETSYWAEDSWDFNAGVPCDQAHIVDWIDNSEEIYCQLDCGNWWREIRVSRSEQKVEVTDRDMDYTTWHILRYEPCDIFEDYVRSGDVDFKFDCDRSEIITVEVADPPDYEKGGFLADEEVRATLWGHTVKTTISKVNPITSIN